MPDLPAEAPPTPPRRRVELDLEPGSDPIRGYVSAADGKRNFSGWVDLASAIAHEAAVADPTEEGR